MNDITNHSSRSLNRRRWFRESAGFLGGAASATMLLGLGGCSSTPKAPAEPPPPPVPVSALKAFTSAYGRVRGKGGEMEILSISNLNLQAVESKGGKSGIWQFQFVAPAAKMIYNVRYAVADELPSFREGAWDSGSQSYDPRGMRAQPFPVAALRCDSTTAYEIAVKEAKDFLDKNPNLPVNFLCEMTDAYQLPTWRVYWGASISTAVYSVYVDANQSKFLKKGKG
ncbi:MAG: hypothetical protein IT170_13985 [Bryobacterales bacterium]|nr:hypothetical protein [Bryobacterales bacterium]